MYVFIVEDDQQVADYIARGLRQSGHQVAHADDGREGLLQVSTQDVDLLIVDRMLPGLDGITLVKTLRGAGNRVPVLILSALSEVDDRVQGLRAGGDDYLVKPFAFTELLARVEVLGRRAQGEGEALTRLFTADLEVDLIARRVNRAGREIHLQAREFSLLEYLLRHKGQIVTRTMLLEHVWHYHFDPQTNVIDVHISRLRRKIDADGDTPLIRTVRGAGYIIDDRP